ncbi:MAG: LamG-like jellyroll fold domain-containing protein [bacterium]|nr:LamG-like jellyroll fold domain-containing protein [bacterium]
MDRRIFRKKTVDKILSIQGFTLIELLVVIAVVGVLAGALIVLINPAAMLDRARIAKGKSFYGQLTRSLGFYNVGEWKFNDASNTGMDSSGNNLTGTLVGGVSYVANCDLGLGGCLTFDGTDDRVGIPTSSLSLPRITISAWIKTTSSTEQYIAERSNSSFYFSTGSAGASGKVCFYLAVASANWLCSSNRVDNGSWHHVAGTYDGTNKIIYIDGTNAASIAGSGDINPAPSSVINIGVRNNAGVYIYYFTGQIDEVSIFNQALSQAAIQQYYAKGVMKRALASTKK